MTDDDKDYRGPDWTPEQDYELLDAQLADILDHAGVDYTMETLKRINDFRHILRCALKLPTVLH